MPIIHQDDVIRSVADALQYISFYHPADYIANLARAYEHEQSPAAKDAIAQILINSRNFTTCSVIRAAFRSLCSASPPHTSHRSKIYTAT